MKPQTLAHDKTRRTSRTRTIKRGAPGMGKHSAGGKRLAKRDPRRLKKGGRSCPK
jgi:hypothetical protein